MKTPEIIDFLLQAETLVTHNHLVWAGGQPIVHSNGTNPRVRQLPVKAANEFGNAGLTDKSSLYEIRIIYSEALDSLVRYDVLWELSLDGGAPMRCKCIQILAHPAGQNVGWLVTVER
jgi:hypothetical protein